MLAGRRDATSIGTLLVLVTVLTVIGLRAFISLQGYLYADDFAFRYWAHTQPLDLAYLTQSYGGHVNPIGLFNQWVLQAVFPGSHTALAVLTLLLWTVTLGTAGAVSLRLTGRPVAAVIMVLLAGLSLFSFENTTWWAAAIYAGPYQLFLVAGVYAVLRLFGDGSARWRWMAALCSLGATLSFSRGFMAAVLMFLLAATLPLTERGPLGIRDAWRRQAGLWSFMILASSAGVLLVLLRSSQIARPGFDVRALPGYMWSLLVENVLPAVWGGPWRWFEIPPPQWQPVVTNPAPSVWMMWLFGVLSVLGCVWIWRSRPALRGLLLATIAFAAVVLLIAGLARSGTVVESVAYRYTFDIVWPVVLLVTLCVVPMWWQKGGRTSRPGVVVVGAICASCLVSLQVPAGDWMGNEAKAYMSNARDGFSAVPDGQLVLDQGVPEDLIHRALMAPYANAAVVFTPEPGAPTFGPYAADTMYGFAPDGRVEIQDVEGPKTPPGPDPDCGYRVTDVPRSIPLDGRLIAWDFYARVAYFTGEPTTLNLAVGGKIHSVPLEPGGLRAVYFPVNGPGQEVLVSVGTHGAVACVTEVHIGNRVSAETGELVPLPVYKVAQ